MKNFFFRVARVTLENWLSYHPYDKEVPSDQYYIRLCNDIRQEITHNDVGNYFVESDYRQLSCMLVCYFEDIRSQTGMWLSFIEENKALYGKYLPFYDTTHEYICGEVNKADIQFLIWHFVSTLPENEHLTDPYSIDHESIADLVYDILKRETAAAPNHDLKSLLTLPKTADVPSMKRLMEYFFFDSYLNHYHMAIVKEEVFLELKNQKGINKKNISCYARNKQDDLLFNSVTPLLAQHAGTLLANRLGESHAKYSLLMSVSERKEGFFRYKNTTVASMRFEHIASGMVIGVTLKSIPHMDHSFVPDVTVIRMGVVQWGEEWWMTGNYTVESDPGKIKITECEKYLFAPVASQIWIIRKQEKCFLEINHHQPLVFFNKKKEVFSLIDRVWDLYHETYGPEEFDRKLFDIHQITFGIDDDLENITVFFNPDTGMEFYPDIAPCIADKRNPFFNHVEADIEEFLFNHHYSSNFVAYLIEHRLIEIEPILSEGGFQYVWNNDDFLLRYYKRNFYKGKPKLYEDL